MLEEMSQDSVQDDILVLEEKSRSAVQDDTMAGLGHSVQGINVSRLQSDPFLDDKSQDDNKETTMNPP